MPFKKKAKKKKRRERARRKERRKARQGSKEQISFCGNGKTNLLARAKVVGLSRIFGPFSVGVH
ncbi:MAG: hypothetical protein OEZ18_06570 [Candidatus Bathyarchaeota archaeon]|nr:hypothetical protein [Candidatus Bathyarchaeota archaeon]